MKRMAWLILAGVALAGCGGSSSSAPTAITITGMTFSPTVFTVAQGGTVTVENMSTLPHTFTSEAAENDYTPGAPTGAVAFDEPLAVGGSAMVTIPVATPVGTNIWFYCKVHTTMMNQGYIHVVAPGGGGGPY
jgi:plastocyanin